MGFLLFAECDPNLYEIVSSDPHPREIRSSKKNILHILTFQPPFPNVVARQIYLRNRRLGYLHTQKHISSNLLQRVSKSYFGAFFSKQINLPPCFMDSNEIILPHHFTITIQKIPFTACMIYALLIMLHFTLCLKRNKITITKKNVRKSFLTNWK